mmetsp:Transcript_5724/g.12466  ORF Transcript_5724/g.12466 Transcript_5724/m.12466 type:complete len:91 (+) Transcript_5724:543-815(+)
MHYRKNGSNEQHVWYRCPQSLESIIAHHKTCFEDSLLHQSDDSSEQHHVHVAYSALKRRKTQPIDSPICQSCALPKHGTPKETDEMQRGT